MAHHDALSDLPNRVLLHERLNQILSQVLQVDAVALLYLDVDHFKNVNDTLVHSVGGQLLKALANRLDHCVSAGDWSAGLVVMSSRLFIYSSPAKQRRWQIRFEAP